MAALASRGSYDRSFPDAGPWLFGVARNTLRRHWRSRPAEEPVPDMAGMASGWDPWPAVDSRVDTERVLRAALARLSPEEQKILILVAWEDLTVVDAGRALGRAGAFEEARTKLRAAMAVSAHPQAQPRQSGRPRKLA